MFRGHQPWRLTLRSRLQRSPRAVKNRALALADYCSFARTVRQEADTADVVLSFIDVMNVHVLLGMIGSRIPVVVSERVDPVFHQLGRLEFLRPILYRRAAAIVVQSDEIATRVRGTWKVSRVAVIGNPCLPPGSTPSPLEERPKRVIAVGRLHEQKDHIGLITAWSLIGPEREGWQLHICGEGQEAGRLRAAIEALALEDSVFLIGRVQNIEEEYEESRIFVLSSLYEGFPNALVEAMAWGCATVATDCPGSSSQILEHGEVGLVVPPRNPEALADAIRTLMANPGLSASLGERSIRRVADFSEDEIVREWLEVLGQDRVFSERSPGVVR